MDSLDNFLASNANAHGPKLKEDSSSDEQTLYLYVFAPTHDNRNAISVDGQFQ